MRPLDAMSFRRILRPVLMAGWALGVLSALACGGGGTSAPAPVPVAAPTLTSFSPASVSLVANRSAWVRVFVKANQVNAVQPQVRVAFTNGTTTQTLTIPASATSVPTAINETDAAASWNAAVPAAWIQPGLTVLATVNPAGAIPEADTTNNRYPQNGTPQVFTVEALSAWKVRLLLWGSSCSRPPKVCWSGATWRATGWC